jgi:hypothetical protein
MLVLSGMLLVDDYERLDDGSVPGFARVREGGSQTLGPGGLDLRSGRFDLHRVAATLAAPALSLHVYSVPLGTYLVYDELAQSCQTVFARYDDRLSPRPTISA